MKSFVFLLCLVAAVALAAPNVVARVQDAETRQALAGAMVTTEGSDIMAVTDSSGQCFVVALPKRGGTLLVSRSGYLDARLRWSPPARPAPDSMTVEVLLYSDRPRVVVGRVFDAGTKFSITGARVTVVGSALAESTVADGVFLFSQFPPGTQTVEASLAGYPSKSLAVQAKGGETTGVELYLLDTANVGSIEGTVVDAGTGQALAYAQVTVEGTGCRAETDSAGHYTIENVPVGMNRMLVSRDGYLKAYTVVRLVKNWAVTVNLYLRKPASRSTSGK
jgi:hypothetical protein